MLKRIFSSGLACICLAIVISSCGLNPFFQGTNNNEPVSISTNQATYHSGDAIQVGVTNNFKNPIYARSGQAGCSILTLSTLVGSSWTESRAAPCTGQNTSIIKISSGQTYNATIKGAFAVGSYRFSLAYSTNSNMMNSDISRNKNTSISATFSFAK